LLEDVENANEISNERLPATEASGLDQSLADLLPFQESVQGASSIRAYQCADRFERESQRRMDYNLVPTSPPSWSTSGGSSIALLW